MSVTHVAECPDLGPQCFDTSGTADTTPYNHHIDQVIAETILSASLGLTPNFGVDARWSLRVADVHPTYSELDGTPKEVPDDIHHHDETLVDLTDPWLLARFAGSVGHFVSMVRAGLSFPVGRTEDDPYRAGQSGESHEHLQAGTGTLVPIVGFGASYQLEPVTLGVSGTGLFSVYENARGFRAPSRYYASQRTTVALLEGALSPFAELSMAHETEEYWQGRPGLEGSNVRTEVYVGGGASYRFAERWTVDGAVTARVATLTDAPAFKSYGIFSLGLSARFDVWEDAPPDQDPQVVEHRKGDVVEYEKE